MTGYQHIELVMGTAVSVDVRDEVDGTPGLDALVRWLHHVDGIFSTYRVDSQISRLGRGEVRLDQVHEEVREVLCTCEDLKDLSGGAFDAFAVRAPNGTTLDPSGFVKGWAIERGARILEAHGLRDLCLNAGGDVVLRGVPGPDPAWRVGIRHPSSPALLAAVVEGQGSWAVATSATYERGAHIIDPRTGAPTAEVASVTVVGPDLGLADAYATAVFVLGLDGVGWLADQPGYDGLVLTHDGGRASTPGMARWMGQAARR